ncbi:hypothetical protein ACFL23_04920, partial [Patescibacteria group bacterium]
IKKLLTKLEIILFIALQTYLVLLFVLSHQIRFAIPVLIILAILNILMFDKIITAFIEKYKNFASKIKKYFSLLITIPIILLFIFSVKAFPIEASCLLGKKTTNACFEKLHRYGMIYAIDHINQNFKNTNSLSYYGYIYKFYLKNGNTLSEYSCQDIINAKGDNLTKKDIKECLISKKLYYFIDDENFRILSKEEPELNNNKYKLIISEYFINNSEIIYEFLDKPRNSYIKIYKLRI